MNPITVLYLGLIILAAGALVTALTARDARRCGELAVAFTAAAGLCLLYVAVAVFANGPTPTVMLFSLAPVIGASLSIGVDALSGLVLLILAVISFCATLYSVRYLERYAEQSVGRFYPLMLLLFASIAGVVAARDMMFFLVFWEFMTLTSWALVVFEREKPLTLRAGLEYFITTHAAAVCIFIAVFLLYPRTVGLSYGFDALRVAFQDLANANPALVHLVLALFFVGFVTKAGVLPFGFWMPDAYPAAPTPATVVFAGVLEKVGLYGLVRVWLSLLPVSRYTEIWGIVFAVFGTFSLIVGTMAALNQDDAKRLMSFHAIGQIGYMLLGIGAGLYFLRLNPALATVALVAGLFHMLNHSWFKSCLFFSAGSMFYRTGERDLNHVGGLATVMPWTGLAAIIAALSIGGIPPFNGFASKMLIFESTILSGTQARAEVWAVALLLVCGLAAVFISAVTMASFIKFLGSAFFGKVRGVDAAAGDVPLSMRIPQVALALLCVLFGLLPALPVALVYGAVRDALPQTLLPSLTDVFGRGDLAGLTLSVGQGIAGAWNPLWITFAALILGGVAYLIANAGGAQTREVGTWYGGRPHEAVEVAYRGHSFYMPFKQVFYFRIRGVTFQGLYPVSGTTPQFHMPVWLRTLLNPDQWLYYPLTRLVIRIGRGVRRLQSGFAQMYLLWMALGTIAVLAILFLLTGG